MVCGTGSGYSGLSLNPSGPPWTVTVETVETVETSTDPGPGCVAVWTSSGEWTEAVAFYPNGTLLPLSQAHDSETELLSLFTFTAACGSVLALTARETNHRTLFSLVCLLETWMSPKVTQSEEGKRRVFDSYLHQLHNQPLKSMEQFYCGTSFTIKAQPNDPALRWSAFRLQQERVMLLGLMVKGNTRFKLMLLL